MYHGTSVLDNIDNTPRLLHNDCSLLPTCQDNLYKILLNHDISKKEVIRLSKESALKHSLRDKDKDILYKHGFDELTVSFIDKCKYLIPYGHVLGQTISGLYLFYFMEKYPILFKIKNKGK